MLYALVNGDERLAKAHALMELLIPVNCSVDYSLETYESCCDLESELFRRAIARPFLYHV